MKTLLDLILLPFVAYIDYARGADIERREAIAAGKCPLCGKPLREGETECDDCHSDTASW